MTKKWHSGNPQTSTFGLYSGVLKRERGSTATHRMTPLKFALAGSKSRRKTITLPTKPFDFKGGDQ